MPRAVVPPAGASRSGLTVRAAWLGLVLCVLVLSAAVPLREFVAQRGQIARLEEQQAAQRTRVRALAEQERLLRDPAHVERLARERLGYVRPGETAYVVLRPGQDEEPSEQPAAAAPRGSDRPWYSQLWASLQAADRPAGSAR